MLTKKVTYASDLTSRGYVKEGFSLSESFDAIRIRFKPIRRFKPSDSVQNYMTLFYSDFASRLVKRFLFLQQLEKYIGHATIPAKLHIEHRRRCLKSDRPLRQGATLILHQPPRRFA